MFTIYHNPRCTKPREALALLQKQSGECEAIEYLDKPLSKTELQNLVNLVGGDPLQLLRKQDPSSLWRDWTRRKRTAPRRSSRPSRSTANSWSVPSS